MGGSKKRKKAEPPDDRASDKETSSDSDEDSSKKYSIFKVPGYSRKYPENSKKSEYIVFLSHQNENKTFTDKDRLAISHAIRKYCVTGILHLRSINKYKIGITFDLSNNANVFLQNKKLLEEMGFIATIPAVDTEVTGVLTSVPTDLSNKRIFALIGSSRNVIQVRRFMRRVHSQSEGGAVTYQPTQTVAVTFASTELPQYVYLDSWRHEKEMYCQTQVSHGMLKGKQCQTFYGKKYYSFEGIPYARPPVGRLRFSDPKEPDGWNGVRDATKPGNKCCQLNPYTSSRMEGSEDCLYLNVYTPSLPSDEVENLPVLFFVHGGRFIFGYGDYYKPDYYLNHDVVVVTVNYRLNILGFLCLNIPEVPGNAGLKDTVFALRWVRNNIANFNGDHNNVTVFGESAGAGAVASYMTSRMAAGLFHKVIAQSGNSIADIYMVEDDPVAKARLVARNLDRDDLITERDLYEYFLEVPIQELIVAFSMAEIARPPSVIQAFMLPVVERQFPGVEQFFDQYPRIDIARNQFTNVPVLTGMNSHEGALFLQKDAQGNIEFEDDFYYFIPQYLHIPRDDSRVCDIETKIMKFYFHGRGVSESTKLEYINMVSDTFFQFPLMLLPEMLAKHSNNVFVYKFQYYGNLHTRIMRNLGLRGASHGDMIQYQFYRENKHEKTCAADMKIINMLTEAWCSFARTGRPTWEDQETEWLPYTKSGKHILLIDETLECVRNPDLDRLKFWLSITGETSKL